MKVYQKMTDLIGGTPLLKLSGHEKALGLPDTGERHLSTPLFNT